MLKVADGDASGGGGGGGIKPTQTQITAVGAKTIAQYLCPSQCRLKSSRRDFIHDVIKNKKKQEIFTDVAENSNCHAGRQFQRSRTSNIHLDKTRRKH